MPVVDRLSSARVEVNAKDRHLIVLPRVLVHLLGRGVLTSGGGWAGCGISGDIRGAELSCANIAAENITPHNRVKRIFVIAFPLKKSLPHQACRVFAAESASSGQGLIALQPVGCGLTS